MKLAAVAAAAAIALTTPAAADRTVERIDFANGVLRSQEGCNVLELTVSRARPRTGPLEAYLSYSYYDNCNRQIFASGRGYIPVSAVTGDGRSTLRVSVATATVPGYVFTGTPLTLAATFRRIPGDFYDSRNQGTSQVGTVRNHFTGVSWQNTASVTGTTNIGDLDNPEDATISGGRNRYVTITTAAEPATAE